ncbi:EAL domain-containing protein [Marinobacter sp. NP-4(2019)]|uniref:EAL domain-containing protein n=1 Tax=Marinobacter sp. NP-4(2019) TaxID=2488665 RepID=UPI001D18A806|nr:EAL domain-containing protein [Marinobacter sp. NP-4(2019)]
MFDIVQDVYRKLNFEATHDTLTGCLLRHDFEKHLSQTLGELSKGEICVLIAFDIDQFNVINASYGTEAGDALLRRFGTMLQEHCAALPVEAPIGRLGGNEFAILASPLAVEDGHDFAERIRRSFQKETFRYGDTEYTSTLSASICPVEESGSSAGELLNQTSNSLKSVKRLGGNRVEIYKTGQQQNTDKGVAWVSRIDRSIRDGSLYLRAQKIAALANQSDQEKGERYELLLGLTDASGKEISPLAYVEAAEQFRRSSRVDLWVVDEVLNWMTQNPSELARIHTLNVNLSGSSLSDDTFLYELEHRLKRYRELTPKLCFEVTETSAVSSLHYAADFMTEMKKLRCRFALDDFGTGLSSYAYLQRLPVDFVKIDGVFVKDMTSNLTNYALVRSINELSHFLGIQTIAEYVEDMETVDSLREIKVDFAQGYGIAKPRRLDQLVAVPTA